MPPSDPAAVPPPEWAVDEAQREYAAMCGDSMRDIPAWDSITRLARIEAMAKGEE